MKLPVVNPKEEFPGFLDVEVKLTKLPTGSWSSPITDVVVLAKIAKSLNAKNVLEIGCFRGYTTRVLAENTSDEAIINAFDMDPNHGEAYKGSVLESKIIRRVGKVDEKEFGKDELGKYDLIFLDADHCYESVLHDSKILMPLLKEEGIFVWHDYGNWGKFSRKNGVPEALNLLRDKYDIRAIEGSWLAAYKKTWRNKNENKEELEYKNINDVWKTEKLR